MRAWRCCGERSGARELRMSKVGIVRRQARAHEDAHDLPIRGDGGFEKPSCHALVIFMSGAH